MSVLTEFFKKQAGDAAGSAIDTAASDPRVQAAIAAAQEEAVFLQRVAVVVAVAASLVFVFYYVPRFESPGPRLRSIVYRRRRSRRRI